DSIRTGLASVGVPHPSEAYDSFMVATQTVVDSGDLINLGPTSPDKAILMHMVLNDQVIPNLAPPLSGTRPLFPAYGLSKLTESVAGSPIRRYAIFTEGEHGSLIRPDVSPAATTEMQTQMVSFFLSGGAAVTVGNPAVIENP
ncbi:MAG TPA: hypothetical protein VFY12_09405, partial [Arenimonas sp.]|nr:hypothetical protein [Arenimonas sp.]